MSVGGGRGGGGGGKAGHPVTVSPAGAEAAVQFGFNSVRERSVSKTHDTRRSKKVLNAASYHISFFNFKKIRRKIDVNTLNHLVKQEIPQSCVSF